MSSVVLEKWDVLRKGAIKVLRVVSIEVDIQIVTVDKGVQSVKRTGPKMEPYQTPQETLRE